MLIATCSTTRRLRTQRRCLNAGRRVCIARPVETLLEPYGSEPLPGGRPEVLWTTDLHAVAERTTRGFDGQHGIPGHGAGEPALGEAVRTLVDKRRNWWHKAPPHRCWPSRRPSRLDHPLEVRIRRSLRITERANMNTFDLAEERFRGRHTDDPTGDVPDPEERPTTTPRSTRLCSMKWILRFCT